MFSSRFSRHICRGRSTSQVSATTAKSWRAFRQTAAVLPAASGSATSDSEPHQFGALAALTPTSVEGCVGPGHRVERTELRAARWTSGFTRINLSSLWNRNCPASINRLNNRIAAPRRHARRPIASRRYSLARQPVSPAWKRVSSLFERTLLLEPKLRCS